MKTTRLRVSIKNAGIECFTFGAIGPQDMEHFQPEDLKTNDNDINPADYMMKVFL